MKNWFDMDMQEQARLILACFPTLTDDQQSSVVERWSEGEYDATWDGSQQAIADLLSMCRWESLSERQRDQERHRLAIGDLI